ncbi:MAG: tRNA (adenosine(37)-N6)-threonylcarbamoyltransferase complex transferase subunit TsaD [Rhodospirillales bacterium]|jgi:N6-L-threonylcarbamoyladenine synthase|nr:tRNA (adenosine(37)-N6)-threonylcarbamoyltransferase complex transferase subunit TsaD [Rhodospirillales bacterium]HIJ43827.1 tRNA (adenosine(37)-N6)-threonylcarbamoyltransferase complex transferase subunit TsaD [Rhodospirillaceae bacterium]HIJ45828.1 tRNA (adenosine(37)-N6)-threonylcarbamoyltransferase complex transferase subunit TsaD [Rhodospirillaceae bacterium]HIJ93902.1 tRNA (adenosine(37)-N6)-threonylcarbamoyltransferase complex transferase subunit TsaD [Rhodospirillaceae bacterium]HJP5
MIVLGIETSCDETAAAVVTGEARILAHHLLSQLEEHRPFGGIVPEIAARAHLQHIDRMIDRSMTEAKVSFADLDGVAATAGPGLIGGVMVGVMTAKAIAAVHSLAFLAVNHLEGHALSARLIDKVPFPYLLLLVSGGHCQLLVVEGVGRYRRLGTTIDDAIGEAFDKVSKMLGLGFPGGAAVENAAKAGDEGRFRLPRPLRGRPGCHFSFSGLKTAVRHAIAALPPGPLAEADIADICASFQAAAGDVLIDRSIHAMDEVLALRPETRTLVVAGGVAANRYLRRRLKALCADRGITFVAPPPALCTDNAAMIAWAGIERLRLGLTDGLDFAPRPRWPLDPDAPPAAGAGVKA